MATIKERYNRERKLLLQRVRRARAAGYIVPESLIPKIPKRPREESIHRLQALTPAVIRERSTYITPEGKTQSAAEAQKQRYSERAKKGWQTRRIRKAAEEEQRRRDEWIRQVEEATQEIPADELPEIDELLEPPTPPTPEETYPAEPAPTPEEPEEDDEDVTAGEIIYQRVLDDIESAAGDPETEDRADYLKSVLDGEIAKYGRDAVMRGIASAPDEFLDKCDTALRYGTESSYNRTAIASLLTVIRGGVIPSADELAYMDDLAEEYEDDLPY